MTTRQNIGVIGANGRMGQEILAVLSEQEMNAISLGRKASIEDARPCDLLIDFSTPQGFSKAIEIATSLQIPLVSGTTGFATAFEKELQTAAKKIPILWSANMSLGVAVLKKALQNFAALEGFDFQIEELHHKQKKDKPSGTAKALQAQLKSILNPQQQKNLSEPVSIRAGGLFGTHKVFAVSEDELICFEHQALNRKVFASGAVRAAKWLLKKKPGLYKIEDLLGEQNV